MRVIGTMFVKVRCLSAGREGKMADFGRKEDTLEIALFGVIFWRIVKVVKAKK